jgi:3-hydroxyisobutyrate dehydrogenase
VEKFGGRCVPTPSEAAKGQEFVFSCVGNDADLRAVVTGVHGAFDKLEKGTIFIDHTTASADIARELHAAASARGSGFIDAPVSGGQAGAESGALSIMCGGTQKDFDRAETIIHSYARACQLMGPAGSGQLTKLVNQICIAGLVQGLAEGLHFASGPGLIRMRSLKSSAKPRRSPGKMDNRHKTMFCFAVNWMRKDLGLCFEEARRKGATLPVTALADQFYAAVQKMGGARWDTSSLIALLGRF